MDGAPYQMASGRPSSPIALSRFRTAEVRTVCQGVADLRRNIIPPW
jgi:hypothetical protein